ncbi:MAG: DEAD/DEAH box helicase [Nitrososphaeria archaeon]
MAVTFADLSIRQEIMKAIKENGFHDPFPIQVETIPAMMAGRDVVGQAQTGTGKTAAYGVPVVQRLNTDERRVQCIVLVPTRELAMQVARDINHLGKYLHVQVVPVYGGQPIERQITMLRRGAEVVAGTPGRTIDHLRRGTLKLDGVHTVILDEADKMLEMGFREDVEFILRHTPRSRQTALFSATMPEEVRELAAKYMKNPEEILVSRDEIALEEIDQRYVMIDERNKFSFLCNLVEAQDIRRAIIFCRTRIRAARLAVSLRRRRFSAAALHGGMTQSMRDRVMRSFRNKETRLLVATDLAGRGLDIDDISHIINYDIPIYPLTYFHRIGRPARAGKTGISITFVAPQEQYDLDQIRSFTNTSIRPLDQIDRSIDQRLTPRSVSQEATSTSVRQNEEYDVTIEDTSRRGDGVARINGLVVFVPEAKPGDRVRVRVLTTTRNFATAVIEGTSPTRHEDDEEVSRPWFYRGIRRIGS